MNPIFRNTLISGIIMVAAFLILLLFRPEEGSRNMDNLGGPGTTMLFILGMILPGFLFGSALCLALPYVTENNKVIFTLLSGFLYMGLAYGAISRGSTSTLPIVIASGLGGFIIMLMVHYLLHPLPLLQSLIVGTIIGVIAALPFFIIFQSPDEAKSIDKIAGIIGLGIYLYWQAGMGIYLSKIMNTVIE